MKTKRIKVTTNKSNINRGTGQYFTTQNEMLSYFILSINGETFENCYTRKCERLKKTKTGEIEIQEYNKVLVPKADKEAMMCVLSQHIEIVKKEKGFFIEKILKAA